MNASLKFCMNQLQRSTVQSAPDSCSARSARSASTSPRPDSSTSRRTPSSSASRASVRIASVEPATARSGKYVMYAAEVPRSAGAQVRRSSQSNGGSPLREPIRTGSPRSRSRAATLLPVLPLPPSTRIGACIVSSFSSVSCTPSSLRAARTTVYDPGARIHARSSSAAGA